jgi:hypothetical protein
MLHPPQNRGQLRNGFGGGKTSHSREGVQLIDRAISLNPTIIFFYARAGKKTCFAKITGFCVNFHGNPSPVSGGR